jgi:hypothetical protein
MSTLTPYWSDEVSRINTASSAAQAELSTMRSDVQAARQALRDATDEIKKQNDLLVVIRQKLALIPSPADGDPLLVALSNALIALAKAQSDQVHADLLARTLQAQNKRLDTRVADLANELADAKAQAGKAADSAADRQKVIDALSIGAWKTVATEATKALVDFGAIATSRVEASFPASNPATPVLLPRVRARRDIAAKLAQGQQDVADAAFTASHDALAQAQQAFDQAWADVRAYFDLTSMLAADRLTLKSLASLPAVNPILTPAQQARLHDASKIADRETALGLLKAVDVLDEAVRSTQAAYDDAYNKAIAAKPDASLADLQATDLKTPLKNLNKALADRSAAEGALTSDGKYADLQAWIAAIPDTLFNALDQLDSATARLNQLKGPPVATDLIATLASKETDLVTALTAARLAQRQQAAAERGWLASQDKADATQDAVQRLASVAARSTLPAL